MRIIAGSLRGRTFDAPTGQGTRPTTDRVRESLMSSLFSARGTFEGAQVLDAFAGSGALGFEALSRGASRAIFYECDPKAFKTLSRNAEKLGLDSRVATLNRADVMQRPPLFSRPPFDMVFLDPPYAYEASEVFDMLSGMLSRGVLSRDALVVYEHAIDANDAHDVHAPEHGFRLAQRKKYGDTVVDVLVVA